MSNKVVKIGNVVKLNEWDCDTRLGIVTKLPTAKSRYFKGVTIHGKCTKWKAPHIEVIHESLDLYMQEVLEILKQDRCPNKSKNTQTILQQLYEKVPHPY